MTWLQFTWFTWFHLHAELATAKRKEHATEMAALEEAVEVEETIISGELQID